MSSLKFKNVGGRGLFARVVARALRLRIALTMLSVTAFVQPAHSASELEGSLAISGAWAIYPTAVSWAEEFEKKHPNVSIDVTAGGAGKGAADAIAGMADIGMVSREPDPSELTRGIVPVYILKDAVFPVISEKNFNLPDLLRTGVSREQLRGIYVLGTIKNWSQLQNGTGKARPLHAYTRADSSGASSSWASFLGGKQEDLLGVGIYGDPGILQATKIDPVGLGYTNFSYIFTREGGVLPGLKILPIDDNENGVADPEEIIADREDAVRAINAGEYPASRKNYFYIKPTAKPLAKEFIRFALSDEGKRITEQVGASLPLTQAEADDVLRSIQ